MEKNVLCSHKTWSGSMTCGTQCLVNYAVLIVGSAIESTLESVMEVIIESFITAQITSAFSTFRITFGMTFFLMFGREKTSHV